MDFIIGFSHTQKKHDVIWVVVGRLTKSIHFFTNSSKDVNGIIGGIVHQLNNVVTWDAKTIIFDRNP